MARELCSSDRRANPGAFLTKPRTSPLFLGINWLVHPYICSKQPSRGSEIGSEALLAQVEPAVAISRSCERVRTVEGSGPESRARGFPLHGIDHWDGPACAGGPSAFILAPSVSTHHLRRCHWRKNWVHLADSEHVAKRRFHIKLLLWMSVRHV